MSYLHMFYNIYFYGHRLQIVLLLLSCFSSGDIWKQKVISCTKMILKFLSRASVPFQPLNDKVSIFNTENTASSVHSQACHDGRICVENTQIYALLRRYFILQTLKI